MAQHKAAGDLMLLIDCAKFLREAMLLTPQERTVRFGTQGCKVLAAKLEFLTEQAVTEIIVTLMRD